jgi:hypothetical protein
MNRLLPNVFPLLFRLISLSILALLLIHDVPPSNDLNAQVSARVGTWQFDFITWTAEALGIKLSQSAADEQSYLDTATRKQAVLDYFDLLDQRLALERQLNQIYADPSLTDPESAARGVKSQVDDLRSRMNQLQPMVEAILQEQISTIYAEEGFSVGGQLLPPIAFHISALPNLLIISPRDHIEMSAYANVEPGMTADEKETLEAKMEKDLGVSALIEPIGGLGTYPTMIYETTNLNYTLEVCAHEWAHNYLTLRPLGINYEKSGETRTMNETAATIVGREIGQLAVQRYYPEFAPPPPQPTPTPDPDATPAPTPTPDPNAFDFNTEMHKTRLKVDELLAAGKIEEAETYMEERRRVFVEHGYTGLRKLNQAYFAFHGAYNTSPGAGGEDPVGPAVVKLREQSPSLKAFLDQISWMTSLQELQDTVK